MNSIGFGLERLGYIAVRAPRLMAVALLLFTAYCASGWLRLGSTDALSELFRSSSPVFRNYERMSGLFPASEFDVLVIAEGKDLLEPVTLEKLRSLHYEFELADAAAGVISLFSVRDTPDANGFTPPLVPDDLKPGAAHQQLRKRILANPLVDGKLLIRDDAGHLALFVISLNKKDFEARGLAASFEEIRKLTADGLAGANVSYQFAGVPIMNLEIQQAIVRDRIVYNLVGFAIGLAICLALFRHFGLVMIAAACPSLAVFWILGILGLVGQKMNSFINVVPALVMVIAFSDAMHMIFALRRNLAAGATRAEAVRGAIRTVGPACALTSISTAVALMTLTLTDSALIRSFGAVGAAATLLAFISVILVVPTLAMLFIGSAEDFRAGEERRGGGVRALTRLCRRLADAIHGYHRPLVALGIVLLVASAAMHAQLQPSYRLSDQVPDNKESVAASARLDARLTGAHPMHVMVRWPEGRSLRTEEMLDLISELHEIVENHPRIGNVWSVHSLRQWLAGIGETDPVKVGEYLDKLPDNLRSRFLNEKQNHALVTGRVPNLEAVDAVPVMRSLERSLADVQARYPDVELVVTGLTAVAAYQSASMIRQLNRGLVLAVIVVIALVGFAFRSFRVLAISIIPNIFPIFAAGSLLYLTGQGLEYASVIALTVAFGLAVDDTIHVLARYRIERMATDDTTDAVRETIAHIGPVLILTTMVLIVGVAVTILSDLPSMRLFGTLVMTTLIAALLADLFILPSILATWGRSLFRSAKRPAGDRSGSAGDTVDTVDTVDVTAS